MDLVKLGQIAGIAGITVGAAVLVFRSLVEKGLPPMPARDRARVVTTIALCAFGIGVAGIAAWTFSGTQGGTSIVTHGGQSPAAVGGRDVTIGAQPTPTTPTANTPAAEAPSSPAATSPPAGTRIETHGAQSPAAAGGRDVVIGVPPTPPAPPPAAPQPQRP
jgi:hypothetical protein